MTCTQLTSALQCNLAKYCYSFIFTSKKPFKFLRRLFYGSLQYFAVDNNDYQHLHTKLIKVRHGKTTVTNINIIFYLLSFLKKLPFKFYFWMIVYFIHCCELADNNDVKKELLPSRNYSPARSPDIHPFTAFWGFLKSLVFKLCKVDTIRFHIRSCDLK